MAAVLALCSHALLKQEQRLLTLLTNNEKRRGRLLQLLQEPLKVMGSQRKKAKCSQKYLSWGWCKLLSCRKHGYTTNRCQPELSMTPEKAVLKTDLWLKWFPAELQWMVHYNWQHTCVFRLLQANPAIDVWTKHFRAFSFIFLLDTSVRIIVSTLFTSQRLEMPDKTSKFPKAMVFKVGVRIP